MFMSGGVGVLYSVSAIYLSPVIGFGLYFASMVCGQILVAVFYDHIQFLGIPYNPLNISKCCVIGIALTGVALLVRTRPFMSL